MTDPQPDREIWERSDPDPVHPLTPHDFDEDANPPPDPTSPTDLDPANVRELANIAGEIGADVLAGRLTYPSATAGWQLGDLDLSEYLAKFRDRHLVVILAPADRAALEANTCGVCGFAYDEHGECPRCKLIAAEQAREIVDTGEERDVIDQVRDWLGGEDSVG